MNYFVQQRNSVIRYLFQFIFGIGTINMGYAQSNPSLSPSSISLHSKLGFLIAHRANMSHLPQKNNYAFELELSQQDTSNGRWANLYSCPIRGVSFQYQDFGNRDVLGQGYSLFAHTSFPLFSGDRLGTVYFRGGTGLAYITKRYNKETNAKNNAIGSHFNGFVTLQLFWRKYFEKWHLGMGIEFLHYSNAAMKFPNLGLNTPVFDFNLGYNLRPIKPHVKKEVEKKDPKYEDRMADEIRIFGIGGAKQNIARFNPVRTHPIIALQGLYSKAIGDRWKLDMGMDFIYNGANRHYLDSSAYTVGETFQIGLFVGASIHFYQTEFFTGLGAYVYSPIKPFGLVYNRLGFRYHLNSHFTAMIGIKAHLGIADYLEFGFAYRLWRSK